MAKNWKIYQCILSEALSTNLRASVSTHFTSNWDNDLLRVERNVIYAP